MRPEFKQSAALSKFVQRDGSDEEDGTVNINSQKKEEFGSLHRMSVHESDQYFYYLEFEHLSSYGKEMWCKRRREDILLSSVYSHEDQAFEKSCFKFILESYKH